MGIILTILIVAIVVTLALGILGYIIMFLPTVIVAVIVYKLGLSGFGLAVFFVTLMANMLMLVGFMNGGGTTTRHYNDRSSFDEGYMDGFGDGSYVGDGDDYDEGYFQGQNDRAADAFMAMAIFDAIDKDKEQ